MFPPRRFGQGGFVPEGFTPPPWAPQVEPQQEMQTNVGPSPQMMQQSPWGQYGSYEGFRDKWMQRGETDINDLRNFIQGTGANIINPKSGLVRLPSQGPDDPGQILDLGIGFSRGKGRPGWTDVGLNRPQGMQMPSLGPSSGFGNVMQTGFGMGMSPIQQKPQGAQPIRRQLGGGRTQSFASATGYNRPQLGQTFGQTTSPQQLRSTRLRNA